MSQLAAFTERQGEKEKQEKRLLKSHRFSTIGLLLSVLAFNVKRKTEEQAHLDVPGNKVK